MKVKTTLEGQEKQMCRYTPNKVVKVSHYGVPEKLQNKTLVVPYWIKRNGQEGCFVSYQRSNINKKLMKLRWKIVYHFNRLTRKW
jgi:hypothetical protein